MSGAAAHNAFKCRCEASEEPSDLYERAKTQKVERGELTGRDLKVLSRTLEVGREYGEREQRKLKVNSKNSVTPYEY